MGAPPALRPRLRQPNVISMASVLMFFLIGALVALHEYGHVLAARAAGIPIARFAVGIGPTIARFRHGETEYCLGALRFGGYVLPALESEQDYFRISPGRRIVFALGGPAINVVAAALRFGLAAVVADGPTWAALEAALSRTADTFFGMFAILPTRFAQPEQLSGVVGIVAEGSRWASGGAIAVLSFAALLSLNLAVINLLPLPPLDGGKVVLCLLEFVSGAVPRWQLQVSVAGWVLVAGLILYVTVLDVARLAA